MKKTIYNIALGQLGIQEVTGEKDNPEVLKYFDEIGFDGSQLKDETAWCSAFANWVAYKAGALMSGALTARSWLKIGQETDSPEMGDVVVLWRVSRSSWKGHVGFYAGEDKDTVHILGGNQNNQVSIKKYSKERLLGYRDITCDTTL